MIQAKHIIRLAFIILFITFIFVLLQYRYFVLENVVQESVVTHNRNVIDHYNDSIWKKYSLDEKYFNDYGIAELTQSKEFIELSQQTLNYFNNLGYVKVNLYDALGHRILSNNTKDIDVNIDNPNLELYSTLFYQLDKFILGSSSLDYIFKRAYEGVALNKIIPAARISSPDQGNIERRLIFSYYPLFSPHNGSYKILGTVELVSDATYAWNKVEQIERKVFLIFIFVFVIFFTLILYNTHIAQRVINSQHEANRELEEAKSRAEAESSEKTEFLANISHELRTPLNAIIGFSEIMLSGAYGTLENKQYLDYIQDINNSGKHLLSVINDILDFSKASADKLKVDIVDLDLNKLASASMRFVKPRADSAGVFLKEEMPEEHVIIKADPKRLKQALLNLLSNSVKFTPGGGEVILRIEANLDAKEVKIIVRDTGIGMAEKDIPKALSAFGQVDNKHSRKYEGTGLGLPLTKKLVELMNGRFDIASELGKGTTITLTMPYEESEEFEVI